MNPLQRALGPVFVLLWSSGFLAGSLATRAAPPFALTVWRFLLAAVLLAGVAVADAGAVAAGAAGVARPRRHRGAAAGRAVRGGLRGARRSGCPRAWARSCSACRPRWSRCCPGRCWASGWAAGLVGLGAGAGGRARGGRPPPPRGRRLACGHRPAAARAGRVRCAARSTRSARARRWTCAPARPCSCSRARPWCSRWRW